MKWRLAKLTTVVVPALAAMAIAPGSAAALSIVPACSSGYVLTGSLAYPAEDLNADGYVCVGGKKYGAKAVVDNTYVFVW